MISASHKIVSSNACIAAKFDIGKFDLRIGSTTEPWGGAYSRVPNSGTYQNGHLEEIAEKLIVEHLFYTTSIATNNRTPGIFSLR